MDGHITILLFISYIYREKPIEQCITYKSQSHIKRTRKQGPQRLKESKFMNQPPLHDSRTSSSSDKQHAEISSESTGISSTSQSGDHGKYVLEKPYNIIFKPLYPL